MLSRGELLAEYDTLKLRMARAGLEPTLGEPVIDLFSDGELVALIKSEAMRLLRFQRMDSER